MSSTHFVQLTREYRERTRRTRIPSYLEATAVLNATNFVPMTRSREFRTDHRLLNQRLNVQEHNFLYALAGEMRRALTEMVSPHTNSVDLVGGKLLITNLATDNQVFETHYPFRISHLTYETLVNLFVRLVQSNDTLTVFDVKFTFLFTDTTLFAGAGTDRPPPSWVNYFKETWETYTHHGRKINCAAFAIAFFQGTSVQRGRLVPILNKASQIMHDLKWGEYVTDFDILSSIDSYFPDYRICIVHPGMKHFRDTSYQGKDYKFELTRQNCLTPACRKKTIYLLYDVQRKHYALLTSPSYEPFLQQKYGYNYKFCNECLAIYSRYKRCECDDPTAKRLKLTYPKQKCQYCGLIKCKGAGCFRNCRFCGSKFAYGYDKETGEGLDEMNLGHRCIVYKDGEVKKFWKKGDEIKDKNPDYMLWVYDLEASIVQTELPTTYSTEEADEPFECMVINTELAAQHRANLVVCRNAFDEDSEKIFIGENCLDEFIKFLQIENDGYNIAIAHNGSGYDTRLVYDAAIRVEGDAQRIKPIRRGSKFMELRVNNIIFRDSLLFLPSSLSNLAKSFNLPTRKGIFPHLFNTLNNYEYEGAIPDKKYFDLKFIAKSAKDIESFEKWYNQRKNTVWNFKQELIDYCKDDVKILGMLVKIFHDICYAKFNISPWDYVTAPAYVHDVVIRQLSTNLELSDDKEERNIQVQAAMENHWVALLPAEYWFIRKALRGGRTDVRKLRHELTQEEKDRGVSIK